MMMQRIYIFIVLLMMVVIAFGQTNIHEINAIKRSKNCIYAEATLATEQEASELAQELLVKYIEDYIKEDSVKGTFSKFVVKDIVEKSEKLSMKRGEMVRVFLYVKKEDIIPARNLMTLQKDRKTQKESFSNSITMITPKEEKPQPITPNPTTVVTNQPSVITELAKASTAKNALAVLERFASEYKVKRYGAYGECRDVQSSYWLIFDDNNMVCAILGKGQSQRIDYITKKETSLEAYSGKSAVWFTLSDNYN